MTLTTKVMIGLAGGLGLGIAIGRFDSPALHAIPPVLEPIGTLWVNALRMTVLPLVVSAILVGITALPDSASLGRIGGRALVLCLLLLASAAAFAVVVGSILMSRLTIDPVAAAALRGGASGLSADAVQNAQHIVGFSQWLVDLVPTNPVKAAADGAMLPVIVCTVLVGLAMTCIGAAERARLVELSQAVLDTALILVRWVLSAAPIGVFALAVPLATRLGLAAAGAVLYYVAVVSVLCVVFSLAMYLVARVVGRQPLRTFARACAPAQAVAISTRTSLGALPAMLEGANSVLGLPVSVRSFFLPLAAAVLRIGSAVMLPVGVLFLARLYGVDVSATQRVTIALMSIVTTFSVPAIPGGTVIVMVPVLLAANLPVSAVGLLLGIDTIPDMFRTATHVTADMAIAAVLARFEPGEFP